MDDHWSQGKNTIPLIPKSESKYNHDASHILRKVFQDVLEEPTLPENVVQNWATYKIDSIKDKAAALDILSVMEKTKLKLEDINIVEQKLNVNLVQYKAKKKTKQNQNKSLPEYNFPKIDKDDAKHYGLINADDMLPSKIDQSLAFERNYCHSSSNCAICTCPSIEDIQIETTPDLVKLPQIQTRNAIGKMGPSDIAQWKQLCLKKKRIPRKVKPERKSVNIADFKLDQHEIVFSEYVMNVTYKKRFKLQNISNRRTPVRLDVHKNTELAKCFTVVPEFDHQLILSPGLCAVFTVYFRAESYNDIQDTYEACGHLIKLVSYREAPQLALFVLRNSWPMGPITQENFDVVRAQALNDTIEIGACFVGESFESYLIFKNNGGPGKFFFMTDFQWFTQDIDTMKYDLKLDFGNFSIEPNYFELNTGEYIIVKVEFYGESNGTCIENVMLVCDNINWINIDFIADVIIFDKYTVTSDGTKMTDFLLHLMHEIIEEEDDDDVSHKIINKSSYMRLKKLSEYTIVRVSTSAPALERERANSQKIESDKEKITDKDTSVSTTIELRSLHTSSDNVIQYLMEQENVRKSQEAEEDLKPPLSEQIIDFGSILGFSSTKQTVFIHNNSMIHLRCRWEFRETNTSWYPIQIRNMNEEWVQFNDEKHILPAYGTVEFGISLKPNTTIDSYYSIGLGLIVEDIPKCAVRMDVNNPNFIILDKETDEEYSDTVEVQVCLFNAICFVGNLKFEFTPKNIFQNVRYTPGITIEEKFQLVIYCSTQKELNGYWISNEDEKILITPERFVCTSGIPIDFIAEVTIAAHSIQKETVRVIVDTNFEQSLDIKLLIERPHLQFNRNVINLGILLVGNTYERKFKILNANDAFVDWEIREQYKKEMDRGDHNKIIIEASNLPCGDVEVVYRVIAGVTVKWESNLLLFITFQGKRHLDSQLTVFYEIIDTPVCIHTKYSDCPILSPDCALFVNTPTTFKLCFHNLSDTTVYYEGGNVYGDHSEFCDILVHPKRFEINKQQAKRIDLIITPSKTGIFDDIYYSFNFIDSADQYRVGELNPPPPLVVTILFAVEDISVKVILPKDTNGVQTTFIWPPRLDFSYEDHSSRLEAESITTIRPDSIPLIPCNDILDYIKDLEVVEETTPIFPSESELSTFSSDTTTSSLKTETTAWKLNAIDNEQVAYCAIEIIGVPTRQLVKCYIKLENLTPVPGLIQIDSANFHPLEFKKKALTSVLEQLNYIKVTDEWDEKVGPHGIATEVCCVNGIQELKSFGTNEIIISVYANTWGYYKEQVSIDFNNILPLRISLLVDVIGVPLEFPIGVNNIHKTAILRFGTLAYKSNFEICNLRVRNTSVLPINVVWHIFMRHTPEELSKEPITILFDIYHPDKEDLYEDEPTSQGNLMIAHGKIIGKSDTKIFKMNPKEILIRPQETQTLQIGINPSSFAASFNTKDIEAYLIGYPQLSEKFRISPLCKRSVGYGVQPVKAKITASLELPYLQHDMCCEDHHIVLYADKILKKEKMKATKLLLFRNLHQVETAVMFSIGGPFEIESARVDNEFMHIVDDIWYEGIVPPGGLVKLKISLTLDTKEIHRIGLSVYDNYKGLDYFFSPGGVLNTTKYEIIKDLRIQQKGFLHQNIPMTLSVYYPMLDVPSQFDFGEVFISNVKKDILTIKNYSACETEITISQSIIFRTSPEKGIIPPGRCNQPSVFDLYLIFIPQAHQTYNDKLTIHTQIPSLSFKITLEGFGRYNEACYKPDIC